MNTKRTAIILPGCSEAPDSLIGGLPRRVRLHHTLEEKGFQIVTDEEKADLKMPDCHLLIGNDKLHLCTDGVRLAEDRLLNSLRKPFDGVISRLINRRISLAITRLLMNTRIRPNHISIITLLVGTSCGVVVALGGYWAGIIGALLLQIQSVLDGVDGELARLRFQGSRLGQWLDTLSDDLTDFSFLAGLTVIAPIFYLRLFGALGMAAFIITQIIVYYIIATVYRSGDLQVFQWTKDKPNGVEASLSFLFRHDFFCILCLFLALLGRLDAALVLASIGRIIVFVSLLHYFIRRGFLIQEVKSRSKTQT